MPQSVADAKRMFETPEEAMPPARAAPVHKPTPPAPKHKVPEKKPTKKRVKLPSPPRLISFYLHDKLGQSSSFLKRCKCLQNFVVLYHVRFNVKD